MLDRVLFTLNTFDVTLRLVIYVFLLLVLLIAVVAFRHNYVLQVKLSQLVDPESSIHNMQGTNVILKKRRRKLLKANVEKPTLVVVQLDNLGGLYVGYNRKKQLMRTISNVFTWDLNRYEFVTRLDFNKFLVVMVGRTREDIKNYLIQLNQYLDEVDIENYGVYSFYLTNGVYEHVSLDYPKEDVQMAIATLSYATLRDGNTFYFTEDVKKKVILLEQINSIKESALENGQFVPYVQPKICFKTGKVVGGEVLVRWVDEEQNILFYPGDFIPVFESNGFIKTIDLLMFENSCRILQVLKSTGHDDIEMSTNFSKLTLNSFKTCDELVEITKKYGVNPSQIEIEITETEFMESVSIFSNSLLKLRQHGFKVAMDDFGKEYSSISLLVDNKFNAIKVDQFFFSNSLSSDREKHVAKSIIKLLSKVDCKIVLEGIENKQTLDVIAPLTRDLVLQGYYFSKPITLSKYEAFVDTVFDFDYPEYDYVDEIPFGGAVPAEGQVPLAAVNTSPAGGTSINISGLAGQDSKELDDVKRHIAELEHKLRLQEEEKNRKAHEDEMRRLKDEMERIRYANMVQQQPQQVVQQSQYNPEIEALKREIDMLRNQGNNRNNNNDDEISSLRREIDNLRNQQYQDRSYYESSRYARYDDRERYRERETYSDYERLQRQIDELAAKQNNQNANQLDVNLLIERLSKQNQDNNNSRYEIEKAQFEAQSLREKLEKERKEREELEALLQDLQNKDEEVEDEASYQETANQNLNLDLSTLDDEDFEDDVEDEEDDEEEEVAAPKGAKPNLSLAELEAIIKSYQDKYQDSWNQKAKDELKDGYYEVVNGLKYYKGNQRLSALDKFKKMSPELKQLFNIVKNEFMKYNGVTNKLTKSYDCFYVGRKLVAKLSITSGKVKVFLAANPANYNSKQFPHKDLSHKKAQAKTPYYTLVKSQLSVKRINKVYADVMAENGLSVNPNYKPIDYVTKFKFTKSE